MSWETDDTTGFLTHFTGTVADAWFGTDPRYRDGEITMLTLDVEVDKVLQEGYEGEVPETVPVNLPCGPHWFTEDRETVEHPKRATKFKSNSFYGKVIDAVVGKVQNYGEGASLTDGDELTVDLAGVAELLQKRGDPTQASIWKGLSFEFREVTFDFGPNKVTKEQMTARRTMPVTFLGEGVKAANPHPSTEPKAEAAPVPAPAEAPAEAPATESASAPAPTVPSTTATNGENPFTALVPDDAALAGQLNQLLHDAADFDGFLNGVVSIDAVNSNDALLAQVLDQENGPWARVRG